MVQSTVVGAKPDIAFLVGNNGRDIVVGKPVVSRFDIPLFDGIFFR